MRRRATRSTAALALMMAIGLVGGERIDSPIPCRNKSDCMSIRTLPREAFCKDGHCVCPGVDGGEIRNCSSIDASIYERRAQAPLVHRTCKHDQDCLFPNGFCNSTISQCDCWKGYVPSSNRRQCVEKARSIDSTCTDKNQCLAFLANTTCHAGTCICAPGYHYVDNACWRTAGFGRPCAKDQECSHIEGAICASQRDGRCDCAAETAPDEDGRRCLAVARNIGDECAETVQCATTFEHSLCVEGRCRCLEGYHYEPDMARCFINRGLDTICANSYECYQAEDYYNESDPSQISRSLVCEANICTCADDRRRSEDVCVSAAFSLAASLSTWVPLTALICSLSLW